MSRPISRARGTYPPGTLTRLQEEVDVYNIQADNDKALAKIEGRNGKLSNSVLLNFSDSMALALHEELQIEGGNLALGARVPTRTNLVNRLLGEALAARKAQRESPTTDISKRARKA